MKVTISRSKNRIIYYISKSIRLNGRSTTRTVEKLGTEEEVRARAGGMDPYEWAKQYAAELTKREKESGEAIRYSPTRLIRKNASQTINISFLFPQDIYYNLRINEICDAMTERYALSFDLNAVFSRLIYTRVIYHASRRGTYALSGKFLDKPNFEPGDIDRGLAFISSCPLTFQRQLYRKMSESLPIDGRTLYYDCTNYYFEIGRDQFDSPGDSSETFPELPIAQLGLLMDSNEIPLSYDMLRDISKEPPLITNLEKEIINEYRPDKIVVYSEAGLTQIAERKFESMDNVVYVNMEDLQHLSKELRNFALENNGWSLPGRKRLYRIDTLDETKNTGLIYYKEKKIRRNGEMQRMIVTFSQELRERQRWIRQRQLTRVSRIVEYSEHGDERNSRKMIEQESYDGFSVLFTNSDLSARKIIPFIQRRRETEENFRTVKQELRSRSLKLSGRERLCAHFLICYIASLIDRLIELKLGDRYSYDEISAVLREMDMLDIPSEGYIPIYSRSDLTDALHEAFGFRTDNQITSGRTIRKLSSDSKKARLFEF